VSRIIGRGWIKRDGAEQGGAERGEIGRVAVTRVIQSQHKNRGMGVTGKLYTEKARGQWIKTGKKGGGQGVNWNLLNKRKIALGEKKRMSVNEWIPKANETNINGQRNGGRDENNKLGKGRREKKGGTNNKAH